MKRLTFLQKLWIPLILSLLCIAAVATFGALQNRKTSLVERERGLRHAAEMAESIAARYGQLATSGKLSPDEAKQEALATLRSMHFGKDGYVVVIDPGMHAVMNPSKPEAEGKYMGDYRDEKGTYVYRQMVQAAQNPEGGFVDYYTHRPGARAQIRKRSFIQLYAPWNWIFVSGEYLDDIDAAFWQTVWQTSLVVLLISAVLVGVVVLVNRSLIRVLGGSPEYAKTVVRATAGGDLSVVIDSRADEESLIGQIGLMQKRLRAVVSDIQRGAEHITHAMEEIAAGNADLSRRTEAQAVALAETSTSLAQFKTAVVDNSANAKTASHNATDALSTARQGNEAVTAVADTVKNIAASSAEVNEILGMIQNVSFQTNILALNAAVEAARAQEHGRGFAVVASEVRALAQRSSGASREIETIISKSDGHVREGAKLASAAGQHVERILDTVREVDGVLRDIAAASQEQSHGVEQIALALEQIDEATQHNASLVEESAAASAAVRDQTRKLLESVSSFRLA